MIREQTIAFLAADWAPGILEGNFPNAHHVRGVVDAVDRRFQQLAVVG